MQQIVDPGVVRLQCASNAQKCVLEIDFVSHRVRTDEREVSLTPTEFEVLRVLATHTGSVVSSDRFVAEVWGEWFSSLGHLQVHMHHLRRKLGPCGACIVTRRSRGYLLEATPDDAALRQEKPESMAFLAALQEEAAARKVIWGIADSERLITWLSDTVSPLLGWRVQDLVGRYAYEIVHPDDRQFLAGHFPEGGGGVSGEIIVRYLRADGSAGPVAVSTHLIPADYGPRIFAVAQGRLIDPDQGN